jgi:catalase-peroxidase
VPAGRTDYDVAAVKAKIAASGLSVSDMVTTAWDSARTFRGSDMRGGANGARIRLAPQKDWAGQRAERLAKVLAVLEGIAKDDRRQPRRRHRAGRQCRHRTGGEGRRLHRRPCRSRPAAATRPRRRPTSIVRRARAAPRRLPQLAEGRDYAVSAEELMLDRTQLMGLTAPEMTVLVGGLRVHRRQPRRQPTACSPTASAR